jgi:hypothetical protein
MAATVLKSVSADDGNVPVGAITSLLRSSKAT